MKSLLAAAALILSTMTASPARAQNDTPVAERLAAITGEQRPSEIWGAFVAEFTRWAEEDSLLQLHLELGNEAEADARIRKLAVQKLDEALYGARFDLRAIAGLYHLVSMQSGNSEAFLTRYAPVRRLLSEAFYADVDSRGVMRSSLRRHVDWAYLTIRFGELGQEERYRLFALLLHDSTGTAHAPTREEMQAMWKALRTEFRDLENRRRFGRVFGEVAKWEVNPQIDTQTLDWAARNDARIAWFRDELLAAFPEDSFQAAKLELFSMIDLFDLESRTRSYARGDRVLTNFQGEPANQKLILRYFEALLGSGGHTLKDELQDRGLVNLIRNLDFRQVFAGHEGLRDRLTRDLLETLLAMRADFNGDLRTLSLWDQVLGAFSLDRIQPLHQDGIFQRAWRVYLGQIDDFDFEASPLVDKGEIERFRIRHAQAVQRLMLLDPALDVPGAPLAATLPPGSPPETVANVRTDRRGLERSEDLCNLTFHQQN